jgi:Cys-rich repeat protein
LHYPQWYQTPGETGARERSEARGSVQRQWKAAILPAKGRARRGSSAAWVCLEVERSVHSTRMLSVRHFVAGTLLAMAGCEGETFVLDPPEAQKVPGAGGDGGATAGSLEGGGKAGAAASGGHLPSGGSAGFATGGFANGVSGSANAPGEGGDSAMPPCESPPCPQCSVDDHCTNKTYPLCFRGFCVQCLQRRDCAPDQACNPWVLACEEACLSDNDCQEKPWPYCENEAGLCVECRNDDHCMTQRCVQFRCVECATNADCSSGRVCSRLYWDCRPCYNDDECGPGRICDDDRCVDAPDAGSGT